MASPRRAGAPCSVGAVRESAWFIVEHAKHVRLERSALDACTRELIAQAGASEFPTWDSFDGHYTHGSAESIAQYVLVVDALNFCFWPKESDAWEYDRLATSIKRVLECDADGLSATALAGMTSERLCAWFGGEEPPLCDERVRVLVELGTVLDSEFDGLAARLIAAARGSAVRLAELTARHFAAFRDSAIFDGRQVFFYKRAQIFAGDVWGAFQGVGLGAFEDIGELTMFADYRIPQLLRPMGLLVYSDALAAAVDAKIELPALCREEMEIRGATIAAVELLREALAVATGRAWTAVQVDWLLWQHGEKHKHNLKPHHRVRTIFY